MRVTVKIVPMKKRKVPIRDKQQGIQGINVSLIRAHMYNVLLVTYKTYKIIQWVLCCLKHATDYSVVPLLWAQVLTSL